MDKQLLKVEEAAQLLSLGRSKLYQLVLAGAIPSVRIGRSRRVPVAAIEEYIRKLVAEQTGEDN